jgi:hypothetical protein
MGGSDWISTGAMVQRVNFASKVIGDLGRPGIRELVDNVKTQTGSDPTPDALVSASLEQLGRLEVSDETRSNLVDFASDAKPGASLDERIVSLLQLIVATREYQLV